MLTLLVCVWTHQTVCVSRSVEERLYDVYGSCTTEYKSKLSMLLFNLKASNNPRFRSRVLSGELRPDALPSLTIAEIGCWERSQGVH